MKSQSHKMSPQNTSIVSSNSVKRLTWKQQIHNRMLNSKHPNNDAQSSPSKKSVSATRRHKFENGNKDNNR